MSIVAPQRSTFFGIRGDGGSQILITDPEKFLSPL